MKIPKTLEEIVLAHANLEKDGVAAFQRKDFARAIELFSNTIDKDKDNWQARLYLATSYYRVGQMYMASTHLRYLAKNCPDQEIGQKAEAALTAMLKELRDKAGFGRARAWRPWGQAPKT